MIVESKQAQRHKLLQKYETVKKNHLVTFFLCLLLGYWGAHRFYLGQKTFAVKMAVIWAILLIVTLALGFTSKFLLAALWGYWDCYDVLNEVMVVIGAYSQAGPSIFEEPSMLTPSLKHIIPDALRVGYGLFVISELFRAITLTDRANAKIKKSLEPEFYR